VWERCHLGEKILKRTRTEHTLKVKGRNGTIVEKLDKKIKIILKTQIGKY
jgi:hypothetical protein